MGRYSRPSSNGHRRWRKATPDGAPVTLFDDIERNGDVPADYLIGEYDYLNASGRVEAQRIREKLETWLSRYPEHGRQALTRRFRSRDDIQHRGAFFELLLHELARTTGIEIQDIEPVQPNGRAPDFLLSAGDDRQFFLEATLATGRARADEGANRRLREALQAVDQVQSVRFFLHLSTEGVPAAPIAVGRLRRAIQLYVDALDYDALRADGIAEVPTFEHQEHGLSITIQAVPKNTPHAGRAIGSRMLPGGFGTPHVAIKAAVEHKAGHYGEVGRPLIVAVNALEEYAGRDDAVSAVFGTPAVSFRPDGSHRCVRNADGAWRDSTGPVHTRCSGLLFVDRLSPWTLGQRSMTLILNPWARNPINLQPIGFDVGRVIDERLVWECGRSLQDVLGIPQDWPEVRELA